MVLKAPSAVLGISPADSHPAREKIKVREFVVMPDHFHVLITVDGTRFSEVRVLDRKSYLAHKKYIYIDENPVQAGLAKSAEEYPYCSAYFWKKKKGQRLKPGF